VSSLVLEKEGSNKFLALKLISKCSPILFLNMKSNPGTPFSIMFPTLPEPKE